MPREVLYGLANTVLGLIECEFCSRGTTNDFPQLEPEERLKSKSGGRSGSVETRMCDDAGRQRIIRTIMCVADSPSVSLSSLLISVFVTLLIARKAISLSLLLFFSPSPSPTSSSSPMLRANSISFPPTNRPDHIGPT